MTAGNQGVESDQFSSVADNEQHCRVRMSGLARAWRPGHLAE